MRSIEPSIAIQFPLLAGNPGQHSGFDAAEVGADQNTPRRSADHGAGAVPDHRERLRIQALDALVVAGCDRSDGCIKIINDGALQILRLDAFSYPAAGSCTVVPEGTADAIVITSTGEDGIYLSCCRLGTVDPELENTTHLCW